MATPYANSVAITRVGFSGLTSHQAALIDGSKWGASGYGGGVALTYSFPWEFGKRPYYASGYSSDNEWMSAAALDSSERAAVVRVLAGASEAADITFRRVADDSATVGELRFAETARADYAHAYIPFGRSTSSGDVWFSRDYWNPGGGTIGTGSYEYMTIIHELGHALGLKHPFESGASGTTLSEQYDHYQWTVMSYTAHQGAGADVWARFHPTTFMYLDLVALEKLYGPSRDANRGATKYVYREDGTYWQTISDSSGVDTIVYRSSADGGFIDLSNKEFSQLGRPVRFSDGSRTFDTIRFGPSTVIENATGGGGDDRLVGNAARNALTGNGGDDVLIGGGWNDILRGGPGADTLEGGTGSDTLIGGTGNDSLVGGGGDDLYYVEQAGDELIDSSGIDTVLSMLGTYSLGAGLENLTLGGAAIKGTGNELANVIRGNALANVLEGHLGADLVSGAAGNDSLAGGSGNDTLEGGDGDDTLDGGLGNDFLNGRQGADTLVWDSSDLGVNGGSGTDTLEVTDNLDLTAIDDALILNIERIALAAGNLLTLAAADILAISSETDTLTILGDATDTVDIVGDFTVVTEADDFRTYTVGAATLLIDTEIPITSVV